MGGMKRKMTELGMGFILDKIRFRPSVVKYPHGFGVVAEIRIQIMFKSCRPMQVEAMRMWCNEQGLQHETLYVKKKVELYKWIEALEPYASLLTDERNYRKLIYLLENPIPYASAINSTWEMFYQWVADWDKFCEDLEFTL